MYVMYVVNLITKVASVKIAHQSHKNQNSEPIPCRDRNGPNFENVSISLQNGVLNMPKKDFGKLRPDSILINQ